MARAHLLLGSNLGNRNELLKQALEIIEIKAGNRISESSIYETAPWGKESENGYLNQAIEIETLFSAEKLLIILQSIEEEMGRTRTIRWEDRLIDIDILFYDNEIINTPTLKIPHPEISNRRFALVPLSQIAPTKNHPILNENISTLLEKCSDKGEVILFCTL